ncbi:MAG: VCBS repeat-containing protein, partial [Candidatus Omnitrophica bacterium]|nr:VCBS repeat-containing protein [Candidatus Omnitrophota bacterium]
GTDGTSELPAVTFSYQDKPLGFNALADAPGIRRPAGGSADYDFLRAVNQAGDTLVDFFDINGDGKNDRVMAAAGNAAWSVQLNEGASFGVPQDFGPLNKPSSSQIYDWISKNEQDSGSGWRQATDMLDINGDGRPDRIIAEAGNASWQVQLNTGTGFAAELSTWGPIQRSADAASRDYIRYSTQAGETAVEFADLNGDGLPDRVQANDSNLSWKVQWNTGSGFSALQDFGPIERMTNFWRRDYVRYLTDGRETKVDLADLNGDGLPDRVQSEDGNLYWKVQWNTGKGFTAMEDFGPIRVMDAAPRRDQIRHFSDAGEQRTDLFDLNGDGLPDRVQSSDFNTVWKVQYNTGKGFSELRDWGPVEIMISSHRYGFTRWTDLSGQIAVDMADLDGDGLADRIQSAAGNAAWKVQASRGPYPDLLQEIHNGRGGKTTVTFTPSTSFDNRDTEGKEKLPFPVQVVTQVAQEDGRGNSVATVYSYKGGLYDGTEREFRGFREVTVTDAGGTKTIHMFGQDGHQKGKLLAKEVRDAAGNLFSKEETVWEDAHPWGESVDVHFVRVLQVDAFLYDGDESYKQTRQSFTYDGFGNLAATTEEGDVSVTGDERKTVNQYAYGMSAPGAGAGTYIVNTLKKTMVYRGTAGGEADKMAERSFYYDGAGSLDTAPVKGLLTREEEWLAGGENPATEMAYDGYGNIVTIADARGFQTSNEYEPVYHLFLIKITNALGQTRGFSYDAQLAQITTSTDQNGQVTETVYDALGRVAKVIAPLDSAAEPTQEFVYEFPAPDCAPNCVTKATAKVKSSAPGEPFAQLTTHSFSDGLGREIQRRAPAENANTQIVSGNVAFDSHGRVDKQYVPYFEAASSSYVPVPPSTLNAVFTYDAVGRRVRTDYPDGTHSEIAFDDFAKTATDPRGKQIRYTNDAYGRLARVEEFNAGSIFVTSYEYNSLNSLVKTTDNAGNVTVITYDSLSRKTGMTDPDMGAWAYSYDANDNLVSQTDAKGKTLRFGYDALNRVTLKDLPAGETDVIYSYDAAPSGFAGQAGHWAGRLSKVTDGSGTHEFKYDALGRVTEDKKTVDGISYAFSRAYDSMGRVRTLSYPDGEIVTYSYNGFGDVETISGVKNSAATDYVKDVDYNAAGQITFIKYGNGVTSDYAYDAATLRLRNIQTKKPDGVSKLQDLSYAFDPAGNVTQIQDTVNAMSQSFVYDDLNRLIQATGSAYGTQTFQYDSIGNMTKKAEFNMTYGEGGAGPHAVTSLSGNDLPSYCRDNQGACAFSYDANGNMVRRAADVLEYDSENRLKEVKTYEAAEETQNYVLAEGWNLVSFTYLPEDKSISSVLGSLSFGTDYDQISYWDPAAGGWKHFVNDPDFDDFAGFEYGKSYEIYVKKEGGVTFSVTGKSPAVQISTELRAGENFIGPAVKQATPVAEVMAGLTYGTDYSDVKRWNAATQSFELYSQGAFSSFEPGKGYVVVGLRAAAFLYGKTETVTSFVYDATGSRVKKTA